MLSYLSHQAYYYMKKNVLKKPTPEEILLAGELLKRGIDFDPQAKIDQCTVDGLIHYYFHPAKIIVEVDGPYHKEKQQQECDVNRMLFLAMKGYYTIRVDNEEVNGDIQKVVSFIVGWGNVFKKFETGMQKEKNKFLH
ncbi:DUF559 domain-containing protein [Bacillus sp. 165]|uniref:endonuclease domain-containing protein n=1 Tax=Bacillus sp. 165 TaxID=1529117 RepID=UPI001ADBCBED|nr:DUF559 domain-containing protein [Bacillus sp. 165]MBO9128544.1 DUF559 domain-containing protein [Bacillus sp. 165]